jgi:hypothetical protein
MKYKIGIFAVPAFLFSTSPLAKMGQDYYPNSRDLCQIHAQVKAGKFPAVNKARSSLAKVTPINKGNNLKVTAWDEMPGKLIECICVFEPGDADLYPSVRLVSPPDCRFKP